MKGFLYLVEIIVAGVLISIIFGSFFAAQNIKSEWGKSDLISVGNNIFDALGPNVTDVLNSTIIFDTMENMKPANVEYTIKFSGIPKQTINVGTNDIGYVQTLLTDAYVNGRTIKFNVSNFETDVPFNYYDIVVVRNYDYSDVRMVNFVKTKPVIGIESALTTAKMTFFNLTSAPNTIKSKTFRVYNNMEKYFNGIGFVIDTNIPGDSLGNSKYNYLRIYETNKIVNITTNKLCLGNTPSCVPTTNERGIITTANGNFLVKKIDFPGNRAYLGVADSTAFNFDGFLDANYTGNNIIGTNTYAAVTKNNTAIWVSPFTNGDEYKTLIKSLVASSVMDWYMGDIKGEFTEVPRVVSMCCDIPETAEMSFVLWYVY